MSDKSQSLRPKAVLKSVADGGRVGVCPICGNLVKEYEKTANGTTRRQEMCRWCGCELDWQSSSDGKDR